MRTFDEDRDRWKHGIVREQRGELLLIHDGDYEIKCRYHQDDQSLETEQYSLRSHSYPASGGFKLSRRVDEGPARSYWNRDGDMIDAVYYEAWPGYYRDAAAEIRTIGLMVERIRAMEPGEFANVSHWHHQGTESIAFSPYHIILNKVAVPLYMKSGKWSSLDKTYMATQGQMIQKLTRQARERQRWLNREQ
jgi:hypothetical protein